MSLIPENYRPRTIRGVIVALMNEFNGLKVENFTKGDGTGNTISKFIPVSIQLGHFDKFQQLTIRRDADKENQNRIYTPLPKMALTWDSMQFNGERATSQEMPRHFYDNALGLTDVQSFITDVNPTPWDLGFTLEIRTQSLNHLTQLMENILNYFNPSRYLRVKEFSFLNIERNLKVRLDGVSQNFTEEETEENMRFVRASLQITVEAWLYRPLTNQGIIKEIRTKYFISTLTGPTSALSPTVSSVSEYNTSGHASSADFTGSFDFSGTTSGAGFSFEHYIEHFD